MGLTLGEAILLLLFCLLLVLAIPLIQSLQENKEIKTQFTRVEEEKRSAIADLTTTRDQLKSIQEIVRAATPGKGIEDLTREYALLLERTRVLEQQLAAQQKAVDAYATIAAATKENLRLPPQASEADVAKALLVERETNKRVAEKVAEIVGAVPSPETLSKVMTTLGEMDAAAKRGVLGQLQHEELVQRLTEGEAALNRARLDLANTRGQLENLRAQLKPGGPGVEAVPCWATLAGKPEYIFDVALTTRGLVVRDRKLPNRVEDQSRLPLSTIVFEEELTPQRFIQQTRPLFEWSTKNECRFFVRAFDKTALTEKEIFKRHLRFLDTHFYKYEELNESF